MFRQSRNIEPIGVDVGIDAVRLLQLRRRGAGLCVAGAACLPMPAELRDRPAGRLAAVSDLLRGALKSGAFAGRRVVLSVPQSYLHIRNLRLPNVGGGALASPSPEEAGQLFAFGADEADVRFLPAGEIRQGGQALREVLAVALRHDDAKRLLEAISGAGAVVTSLQPGAVAAYRSLCERAPLGGARDVHAMVDLGAQSSRVIIGRGPTIRVMKVIDIGAWHLHEAVARKLGITPEESRQLRGRLETPGCAGGHDGVRRAVFAATRRLLQELASDIAMCLQYYAVTFRGPRPEKLVLVGGMASDPAVCAALNSALTVQAEPAQPFAGIEPSSTSSNLLTVAPAAWACALGLASHRLMSLTCSAHQTGQAAPPEMSGAPGPIPMAGGAGA